MFTTVVPSGAAGGKAMPQSPRVKKAIRLESDLDINVGAVAIILDLLDEIDELRAALRRRVR